MVFVSICCIFTLVNKLFPNLTIIIVILFSILVAFFPLWRSEVIVSYRDCAAERMCANTGAWTQLFSHREAFSTHYTTALAFPFSNVNPVRDLQHWVIGSGHNLTACLWPASCVKQVFRKLPMRGAWRGVKAPSLSPDPLTRWPTLTTPLPPDPWTPTQRICDLRVACHWTSGGPDGNRVWSYSRWAEGGIYGEGSEWRRKVVYVRSGCLDCLE